MVENDKSQINFRVAKEQKERWEEYGKEAHGSLSQFLRRAAEREMSEDESSQKSITGDVSEELSEIQQSVGRIEGSIDDLDRRLRNVESAVAEPSPNIRDLANEVLNALPDSRETVENVVQTGGPSNWRETGATRIKDLALKLDEDEHLIKEAIEVLKSSYMVEYDEYDGSTYYWGDY